MNELVGPQSVVAAVIVAYLVQKAKLSGLRFWSWIRVGSPWVIRGTAAAGAALTAAGFSWVFADGQLIIDGLTLSNATHFVGIIFQQFVFQELSRKILYGRVSSQ